jgi:hypothetical protein
MKRRKILAVALSIAILVSVFLGLFFYYYQHSCFIPFEALSSSIRDTIQAHDILPIDGYMPCSSIMTASFHSSLNMNLYVINNTQYFQYYKQLQANSQEIVPILFEKQILNSTVFDTSFFLPKGQYTILFVNLGQASSVLTFDEAAYVCTNPSIFNGNCWTQNSS